MLAVVLCHSTGTHARLLQILAGGELLVEVYWFHILGGEEVPMRAALGGVMEQAGERELVLEGP